MTGEGSKVTGKNKGWLSRFIKVADASDDSDVQQEEEDANQPEVTEEINKAVEDLKALAVSKGPAKNQSRDKVSSSKVIVINNEMMRSFYTSLEQFDGLKEIARGRGSVILSAKPCDKPFRVAIKAYDKAQVTDTTLQHIRREACITRGIRHDTICEVEGAFEDPSFVYVVMELCPRGDLMEHLNGRHGVRKLAERDAVLKVLRPLLVALRLLHRHGVVHRDIKPENLFLAADGSVKLGDFGLAINQREEAPKSQLGTLDYMAPEVFHDGHVHLLHNGGPGYANYNEKVDVWACGVLAFEVVTGEPPFNAARNSSLTKDLIQKGSVPLSGRWPLPVSPELKDFVRLTLQKNPAHRPSAEQLLSHPWIRLHASASSSHGELHNTQWAATASPGTPSSSPRACPPPSPRHGSAHKGAAAVGFNGGTTHSMMATAPVGLGRERGGLPGNKELLSVPSMMGFLTVSKGPGTPTKHANSSPFSATAASAAIRSPSAAAHAGGIGRSKASATSATSSRVTPTGRNPSASGSHVKPSLSSSTRLTPSAGHQASGYASPHGASTGSVPTGGAPMASALPRVKTSPTRGQEVAQGSAAGEVGGLPSASEADPSVGACTVGEPLATIQEEGAGAASKLGGTAAGELIKASAGPNGAVAKTPEKSLVELVREESVNSTLSPSSSISPVSTPKGVLDGWAKKEVSSMKRTLLSVFEKSDSGKAEAEGDAMASTEQAYGTLGGVAKLMAR